MIDLYLDLNNLNPAPREPDCGRSSGDADWTDGTGGLPAEGDRSDNSSTNHSIKWGILCEGWAEVCQSALGDFTDVSTCKYGLCKRFKALL